MTTIGTSDIDVLPLTLGGNTFGWTADRAATFEILDAFVAGGGSVVDTADTYSSFVPGNSGGESETLIGEWLTERGARDKLVIATKVGMMPGFEGLGAANIAAASAASLERLQTDVIDIYYAHKDDPDTPLEEAVGAFAQLVSDGKVRYIGLSNFAPARIDEWFTTAEKLGVPAPIVLQPEYSLMVREPYESQIAPNAQAHNLGVMPYFTLASGFLTGKYTSADEAKDVPRSALLGKYLNDSGFAVAQTVVEIAQQRGTSPATVALAWLQAQPTVTAPIASASKLSHLQPLLDSATLQLTDDEVTRLSDVSSAFQPA